MQGMVCLMALLMISMSQKAAAQALIVGSNSSGQTTNFTSGTNTYSVAYIGATATDSNNTLNVFNTNTRLTITGGNVQVGYGGNNNSMVISNGGFVSDVTGVVSFGTGSNNSALVTGAGSTWSNSTQVRLGVSGQGSLTVANEGSVIVTGVNGIQVAVNAGSVGVLNIGSYGGNDSAGLIIAPKIAFGSGTGTLNFNQTNTFTLTNAITGLSVIVFQQLGSGTTILTGANSSANSTFISQGTLQLGDGGANGSIGNGAITNNSVLAINSSTNITFGSGNGITGTGVLVQMGTGTTTVNGSNTTYSGGTLISSGTLQVGAGALGALYDTNGSLGTGNVTNNAILAFARRAASDTVSNNISGTGALTVSGNSAALTLAGSNSYSGLTTINSGNTLQIGTGSTNGTLGTGSVSNAGTLTFNRSDLYTASNAISGAGALSQIGSGTTILSGSNSYSGGTTVTNGMLQIGNGGTSGSVGGGGITLSGAGLLAFNRADSVTLTNTIGGGGGVLSQMGAGTLVIMATGATYGGTVISSGTLQLGDGGANGAIGSGAITNNSVLAVNSSTNITFASGNGIRGTGALIQMGTGTTILNASNTTYSGGTLISGGTLQVGTGVNYDTNGSLGTGNVTNNATLAFKRIFIADTVSNSISGTGALTIVGSSSGLTLAGSNSYSGLTTITTNNTLQIGIGGTNGTLGSGSVSNAGTLTFNRSDLYTVTNTISGSGALSQIGSGTTILSGSNSYSGGTTVTNGMLHIGNGGTSGSVGGGAFTINVGGTLAINRSDTLTLTNYLSANGTFQQLGSGTTILTRSNSAFNGAFLISSGTLQIGDGGANGPTTLGAITTNNSLLAVNSSTNFTFASGNGIRGTGALIQMGTGTTILNASNTTYSGGTLISGGTLQVGTGANVDTNGSLGIGNVTNNATLVFKRGYVTDIVSNNISGTGVLTMFGSAAGLTLAGSNSYSGLTTISSGYTLQIGTGSTNGTLGTGSVSNEGTLTFNRSDLYTISNAITGSGALSQIGSGTTILSGSNSYTGNTTITSGTLAFNGTNSGTGLITVATNAALQGTGVAAGNVTMYAGGSLTPGSSSIGTLTVAGITFIRGGTFNILLGGSSSSLLIQSGTGTSTRGGNLVFSTNAALTSGYYTFMTNSSTGAFSSSFNGTNNLPSGYAVVYTTNTTALQQLAVLGSITTSFVGTNAIITGGSAAFTVGVSNSAFAGGQSLDFTGTSSNNTIGTIGSTTVTAQAATNVSGFSFNGTNVGATQTGAFTINAPTASPTSGRGTVTVDVYGHAVGSVNSSSIALSNAIVGYSNAITTNLIFSNAAGFNVALQTISSSTNSNLSLANVSGVATNAFSNAALTLAAGQGTGTFSNNVTVVYGDSSSLSGARTNLSTNTVAVTGAIYGHASGSLTSSNVTLQSVHVGYTNAQTNSIGVTNAAGFRVALQTTATNSSNSLSLGSVSNISANSSGKALLSFTTRQGVGSFTNTIGVIYGDESTLAGASSNVGTNFLTVSGLVYSGQSTWTAAGSVNWTNFANWSLLGGTPGLDGSLSTNDSATFGTGAGGTVTLNTNAALNALIFSNSSAYTVAGSGTIDLVQGSNAPSIASLVGSHTISNALTLATNVTVTNASGTTLNVAGNISGSGNLSLTGSGTLVLTGNNSFSGGTAVSAGKLQLDGGGTLGSGNVAIAQNSTLILNHSTATTLINDISGQGNLSVTGSSTSTLGGVGSYTGSTAISGGSLSLGSAGSVTGGGAINVNGGTLLLGAANQVNKNSALTLGSTGTSGILSMGGNGSTRASSQTFNTLTLSANSSIDYANLTGQSDLYFSKIGGLSSYTLSIFNYNGHNLWDGNSDTGGVGQYTMLYALAGAGTSGFTAPELNNIKFYGGSDTSSLYLGEGSFSSNTSNGFNQIVPVPEPGVVLAGLLLLGWMIFSFRTQVGRAARALLITLTLLSGVASMNAAPKPTATPKPTPTPIPTPKVVATPTPAPSATVVPTPPPAQSTPYSP